MTDELRSAVRSLAELLGEAGRHPPARPETLGAAVHRLGIPLPGSLRTLLETFDGSAPTDVDHGWVTFWSANELEPRPASDLNAEAQRRKKTQRE